MPSTTRPWSPIHSVATGSGAPALVFVHGALCALGDWRHQVTHFARRHRVLALDLPGHGQSAAGPEDISIARYAQAVVELCRAEGVQRAVLVGHSMACRVLLQTWRSAPTLVAGIVCVDGAYLVDGLIGLDPSVDREALAQRARERAAAPYVDATPAERARHGFAQMFFDERFAPLREAIVQRAMALPPEVARTLMPDFAAWDTLHMEPTLARIDVPMRVIACTWMTPDRRRSMLAPGDMTPWLEAIGRFAPHAQVLRYEGSGHFPMLERPLALNSDIEAFLATLPD